MAVRLLRRNILAALFGRSVDADDRYDDVTQESRDAEEKYFDESDEEEGTADGPSPLGPDEYDY